MSNRWNVRNSAPLGSPENPEIIEPGQTPRARHHGGSPIWQRSRASLQTVTWMLYLLAPAIFIDSVCFWLFDSASHGGGAVAWLLLILFTPPALLLTLVATVANFFLFIVLTANLLGKPLGTGPAWFVRFTRTN